MVRIRLRRSGLKKQITYRIVAAEKESPRNGRFLEILGSYNPRQEPFGFAIEEDRVYYWLSNGAQPSESVVKLFKSVGLMDRYARFKNGESVDSLMAEAKDFYSKRESVVKTHVNSATPKKKSLTKDEKKAKAAAAAASAAPAAAPAAPAAAPAK